jgi:hypothetical protein
MADGIARGRRRGTYSFTDGRGWHVLVAVAGKPLESTEVQLTIHAIAC